MLRFQFLAFHPICSVQQIAFWIIGNAQPSITSHKNGLDAVWWRPGVSAVLMNWIKSSWINRWMFFVLTIMKTTGNNQSFMTNYINFFYDALPPDIFENLVLVQRPHSWRSNLERAGSYSFNAFHHMSFSGYDVRRLLRSLVMTAPSPWRHRRHAGTVAMPSNPNFLFSD